MRAALWLVQIVLCLGLIVAAGMRLGPIPPIAPFVSPFEGFWLSAEPFHSGQSETLHIRGLEHPVEIAIDQRGVPHVFAKTESDAYVAQGYCVARDRLWQIDVIAREAGGRLAEVMGPDLLDHDLMRRRFGLNEVASAMAATFAKHAGTNKAVTAYCQGINAYIAELTHRDWPLEFKLLGYAPEPWTPEKVGLLIASMQWTLSAGKNDLPLTATLGKYGPLFFKKFFPSRDEEVPTIFPPGTTWPLNIDILNPTQSDSSRASDSLSPTAPAVPQVPIESADTSRRKSHQGWFHRAELPANYHGSNNFVLAPSRTANGHALLANDPHLDLTLPSTWYEIQLQAPGLNVYGVALPGAPGIVIGFNDHMAWGLTNGADDVFDWYRIRFRDSTLAEYFYDNRWVPTRHRVDTVYVRGGDPVFDTIFSTHHGPVVLREPSRSAGRNVPMLHALRWLAHDSSDQVGAILRLQGCDTFDCFRNALVGYACPSQNFAFASLTGEIGMVHMGRFPYKWNGQGRLILDGSDPGHDWQGWVPWDRIPHAQNPSQGFLASANQEPVDTTYPYYLGSHYTNPDRSVRLHERLVSAQSATVDTAFSILRDDQSLHARLVLPKLLQWLDTTGLNRDMAFAVGELRGWNYAFTPDGIAPTLFEAWWQSLYRKIWGDDFGEDDLRYQWPNLKVTRKLLLNDSASAWFDDVRTPQTETLGDLVNAAFRTATHDLAQSLGSDPSLWRWHFKRPVAIRHLLRLPAFSAEQLIVGGCPECVDAQKATHGPSWRMVVELSNPPKAFGIYPGGQSGNPGSPHYDDFVNDWAAGRKYSLNRMSRAPGPNDSGFNRLTLEPR
jgi:penicillin G amidase